MSAPTQQQIETVITEKERAQRDLEKMNDIKLDGQQIDGTRYKFVIIN